VKLITSAQAAMFLGVDIRQVQRFAEQGKLLNLGDNRGFRFDFGEVCELKRVRGLDKPRDLR
jgi:hypothetical protein